MDYFRLLWEIINNGKVTNPRGLETKEIINARLTIDNYNFWSLPERPLKKTLPYLYGELAWYFSGSRLASDIGKYSKFWLKLADKDGIVNSNYGYLVYYKSNKNGLTSFEWAAQTLAKDPHSRQAIILYNDRDSYYKGNKDFICTQLQHFLIREGVLYSIIYLRSSDAILGLSYDIPWWSIVHQSMAMYLDVKPGKIDVNIGSSHIYANKYKIVADMLVNPEHNFFHLELKKPIPLKMGFPWYESNINNYFSLNEVNNEK